MEYMTVVLGTSECDFMNGGQHLYGQYGAQPEPLADPFARFQV